MKVCGRCLTAREAAHKLVALAEARHASQDVVCVVAVLRWDVERHTFKVDVEEMWSPKWNKEWPVTVLMYLCVCNWWSLSLLSVWLGALVLRIHCAREWILTIYLPYLLWSTARYYDELMNPMAHSGRVSNKREDGCHWPICPPRTPLHMFTHRERLKTGELLTASFHSIEYWSNPLERLCIYWYMYVIAYAFTDWFNDLCDQGRFPFSKENKSWSWFYLLFIVFGIAFSCTDRTTTTLYNVLYQCFAFVDIGHPCQLAVCQYLIGLVSD